MLILNNSSWTLKGNVGVEVERSFNFSHAAMPPQFCQKWPLRQSYYIEIAMPLCDNNVILQIGRRWGEKKQRKFKFVR